MLQYSTVLRGTRDLEYYCAYSEDPVNRPAEYPVQSGIKSVPHLLDGAIQMIPHTVRRNLFTALARLPKGQSGRGNIPEKELRTPGVIEPFSEPELCRCPL